MNENSAATPMERALRGGDSPLERAAAIAIALFALLFAARYVHAMATTSLWNDEIYTILNFTGKGVRTVVTDYSVPNNHIFFNLLNTLLPGRSSFSPLRARAVSLAAVGALLLIGFAWHARRGRWLAAALFVQLFATGAEFLDLTLQARGYGLLALLALLLSLYARRALVEPRRKDLVALAILSVLGSWTVPLFVFWCAPLLVLVALVTRRRSAFAAVFAAGLAILFVHIPVARQMLANARGYGAEWGRQYASPGAIAETLREFAVPSGFLQHPLPDAVLLVAVAGALAASLLGPRGVERRWRLLLLGSAAAFFVLCLRLQTPLVRSTCFIAVPLVLVAVSGAEDALRRLRPRARALALLVATSALVFQNAVLAASFRFLPLEEWKEVGRFLDTTLPSRTHVFVEWAPPYLSDYAHRPDLFAPADEHAFARGEEVAVSNVLDRNLRPDGWIKEHVPRAIAFHVPQRRSDDQEIWFVPPGKPTVSRVLLNGGDATGALADGDPRTSAPASRRAAELEITAAGGAPSRALVLVASERSSWTREAVVTLNGRLLPGRALMRDDRILVLPLAGGRERLSISIRSAGSPIRLSEVIVFPEQIPGG